jgi:DNA-directed RNA polymerase subunit RPC12/RpoP
MDAKIDLACMMCTEEFVVAAGRYVDTSRTLQCPCCGSTDLVPTAYDRDDAQAGRPAAA